MELEKKKIYMNRQKARFTTQVTVDEDRNIPDVMPDLEEIILCRGEVEPEEMRGIDGRGTLQGKLKYSILYRPEEDSGRAVGLNGFLPVHEQVMLDGVDEKDNISLDWLIEDLSIEKIHSRKVRIRAVITFHITADGLYQESLVLSAAAAEPLETRSEHLHITRIALQKRETYRFSDEMILGGNKPNIRKLIWQEAELRGTDCRPGDGRLTVRGEIAVFAMYQGDGDHLPLQWEEFVLPFSGEIPLGGSREEMIPSVDVRLLHHELDVAEDEDGEQRRLILEAMLELQIRLYENEDMKVICDMYSPVREAVLEEKNVRLEQLLMRNSSRCRVSERLHLSDGEKIMQICHGSGRIMIDDVHAVEEGLEVEGALMVSVLYASPDDTQPLKALESALPFRHLLEIRGIDETSAWRLKAEMENISVMMLGMDEAEIKASMVLEAVVLSGEERSIVTDARLVPYDEKKIQQMPGIVGYRVQPGDTLWKIAKKFYTTVDGIRSANDGVGDEVMPGQRLILIKQAEEIC